MQQAARLGMTDKTVQSGPQQARKKDDLSLDDLNVSRGQSADQHEFSGSEFAFARAEQYRKTHGTEQKVTEGAELNVPRPSLESIDHDSQRKQEQGAASLDAGPGARAAGRWHLDVFSRVMAWLHDLIKSWETKLFRRIQRKPKPVKTVVKRPEDELVFFDELQKRKKKKDGKEKPGHQIHRE